MITQTQVEEVKRLANAEDRFSTYLHTLTDYDQP